MDRKIAVYISQLKLLVERGWKKVGKVWKDENSLVDGVMFTAILAIGITTLMFLHNGSAQNYRDQYRSTASAIDRFTSKYDDIKIYSYLLLLPENAYVPEIQQGLVWDSKNMMRQARLFDLRLAGFTFDKNPQEINEEIDKVSDIFEFLATTSLNNLDAAIEYSERLYEIVVDLDKTQSALFWLLFFVQSLNIIFATRLARISSRKTAT